MWLVHDGSHRLSAHPGAGGRELARQIELDSPLDGGHDPVPALLEAGWSGSRADGTVLWIHGSLPVLSRDDAALRQRLDRTARVSDWWMSMLAPDPNRLLEKLDGVPRLEVLPRVGNLADIGRFLRQWEGQAPDRTVLDRTETTPSGNSTGSRHVVRLWAAREIERLRLSRQLDSATKLAGLWQLVTPVSGAVVLETKAQFAKHGLSPVDPLSAPMVVPEPSTWALLALGGTALAWMGRKPRKSHERHRRDGK